MDVKRKHPKIFSAKNREGLAPEQILEHEAPVHPEKMIRQGVKKSKGVLNLACIRCPSFLGGAVTS